MRYIVFLLALLATTTAAHAQSVSGNAEAIDGDSLTVAGTPIRLFGIDAPEAKQTCSRGGNTWPCGEASAGKLRSLIENQVVNCIGKDKDQYGRIVAVCAANGIELNGAMVVNGWATAFRAYSQAYVADETRAKAARLGIWDSSFTLPADYRRLEQERAAASVATPRRASPATASARAPAVMGRCAIKGNRNRRGQWIYHVPGMPYYDATRAEEIFCSEQQAQAAGYRRAIVR
jgi:endonuclease YncB( thermonuclease family)